MVEHDCAVKQCLVPPNDLILGRILQLLQERLEERTLRGFGDSVRDLGDWFVRLAESRRGGTFNATGPAEPLTMERFLDTCRAVCNPDARLVWVAADFLREREVEEWMDLPLWVVDPEWAGIHETDVSRAIAAGLTFRRLEDTIHATLEWARERADERLPKKFGAQMPPAGLDPDREAELLREFRAPAAPPSE